MNIVIDEVLAGDPRYTIKDNSGVILYDNAQIVLKTQVTTAGTPLNKALFDSIRDDINSRVLTSDKATNAEAQAGTNTSKYLVPSTMQAKLDKMNGYTGKIISLSSQTHSGDNTILNLSDLSATDTGTIVINMAYYIPYQYHYSDLTYGAFITINGTNFRGLQDDDNSYSGNGYTLDGHGNTPNTSTVYKFPAKIEINLNTKTIYITYPCHYSTRGSSGGGYDIYNHTRKLYATYETLTSIVATLKTASSNKYTLLDYSIYYSR